MRRILAIVVILLAVLQYGVAAARAPSPCCAQGCTDPAMCLVTACQGCAAQAVLPALVVAGMPPGADVRPDAQIDAGLPTALADIWRPPRERGSSKNLFLSL